MRTRPPRAGELLALAGAACVIVAMFLPWYQGVTGRLDAWDTFGPAVVLLLLAAAAGLWLFVSTVAERSTALPVAAGVWTVVLGLIGLVSAIVRLLERPEHSTQLRAGPWLALVGTLAVLVGAWLSLKDERVSTYQPASPTPRPRP
jgi:uncharacterized membrane protein HdeD (DUF308 family)